MARKTASGAYRYVRTALVRGREQEGRYAVIRKDREQTRVVRRLEDGSAPGDGILVPSADVYDIKPTHIAQLGQRGTITLPGELRRDLGLEEGTNLEIVQDEEGTLLIRPLRRLPPAGTEAALQALLDQVIPENRHDETPTGQPVGQEAW